MVWKFESTGAPMITPEQELPPNTARIVRPNYTTSIKRSDPNKAAKLIGVHTAITQQMNTELQHIIRKAKKLIPAFLKCSATFHEIWILYTTVLIPSLCFSMPAVTFTEEQTKYIQDQYMPTILKKAGIGNGYPEAVIYGDKQF